MKKERKKRLQNIISTLEKARKDLRVLEDECVDEYDSMSDARQESDYAFDLQSETNEISSFADSISDVITDIENFLSNPKT